MRSDVTTEELKRLAASITPGPWNSSIHGTQVLTGDSWNTICEIRVRKDFSAAQWEDGRGSSDPTANARAIALVPALIREVLAHRKAEAGMRALLRAGCELMAVEAEGLRNSIRIVGNPDRMSDAPEDAHAVEALREMEDWIASVKATLRALSEDRTDD
ncbi:hypothetical protein [Paracoccus sp. J39]|uniref:hypothetical protein n=1 Tax=Paracoccus sp. J39 TaxID=935848 RepID=UPI0012EBB04D|nr:hypothetical protein [Paracoccus sp. J39]